MRNTLKITFILIAIVAFIMIVPNIVNAAEIIADPSKPETADLVEVVNNAETGSTITLAGDYEISNVIELRNKEITIIGNDNTISGNYDVMNALPGQNKSLITAAENCTIKLVDVNLTISPKYGAQAYNGGKLVLNGVDIRDCSFGGILNNGGIVEIIDLTLGHNGNENDNNGIEIGKGSSLANVNIEPKLIMNGTLKSEQKENVIYIASNDELTEFKVENTEASTDKLYISDNKVVVTDENNSVKFESNESDRTTVDSGDEFVPNPVVTLNVQGSETPIKFEVKIGTIFTKSDLEAKVEVPENYQYDGFYTDAEYKIAFDFRTEINDDTTIYVKFTPAGPIEEPTDPSDTEEPVNPSEEEKPTTPSEEETVDGEKDETPKTGVSTYIGVAAFVVVASVATMVVLKKKNS